MNHLEFVRKLEYGKVRFYPTNEVARAIVSITGRKCFNAVELNILHGSGVDVRVREALSFEYQPWGEVSYE